MEARCGGGNFNRGYDDILGLMEGWRACDWRTGMVEKVGDCVCGWTWDQRGGWDGDLAEDEPIYCLLYRISSLAIGGSKDVDAGLGYHVE